MRGATVHTGADLMLSHSRLSQDLALQTRSFLWSAKMNGTLPEVLTGIYDDDCHAKPYGPFAECRDPLIASVIDANLPQSEGSQKKGMQGKEDVIRPHSIFSSVMRCPAQIILWMEVRTSARALWNECFTQMRQIQVHFWLCCSS